MKKLIKGMALLILALTVLGNSGTVCRAEIIPPQGEGQIGLEAVVLCEKLTIRQEPNAASKAVKTLPYGYVFSVQNLENGWADCFPSDALDSGLAGWVNADYIAVDPAWYRTEALTPVYAWNSTAAPKVAQLSANSTLPILKNEGDWILVSLRGAVGWIHTDDAD